MGHLFRAEKLGVGPTLVLCHGLGSDEQDLLGLGEELNLPWNVVALRAPQTYPYGGYAWFDVEWSVDGLVFDEEEADQAVDLLANELRGFSGPVVLGGFSQGAILTSGIVFRYPELIKGAALLSGALLPSFAENAPVGPRPLVFQQHGISDPVLPIATGRELRDALADVGVAVEFREYGMAHQVTSQSLGDLREWLLALDGLEGI